MKKKDKKSLLDERQELVLKSIGEHGFWYAYWALLISVIVQMLVFKEQVLEHIAGEWIIFMCMSIYMTVRCFKAGIWSRSLKPDHRTNLIVGLIASVAATLFIGIDNYLRYHSLIGSLVASVVFFIFIFTVVTVALFITKYFYDKKVMDLESDSEE